MVGYSAGTNIIQKTVLDPTLGVRIRGIMCVCVGVDYIGARNALEDSFQGRMYSRLMTALSKVRIILYTALSYTIVYLLLTSEPLPNRYRTATEPTNLYSIK
jgi:hypothetical protein